MRSRLLPLAALAILAFPSCLLAAPETVDILDGLVPMRDTETKNLNDGLAISGKTGREAKVITPRFFKSPLIITAVAKTDSTNLRLYYGRGEIIFNWEGNQTQLRHHDPASGKQTGVPNMGNIPKNTWVTVRWIIDEKQSRIQVDGVDRAVFPGDYSALTSVIGIGTGAGAIVTIKSFEVQAAAVIKPFNSPDKKKDAPAKLPETPAAAPADDKSPANISVPSAPTPATPIMETPPANPDAIERPQFRNKPHPLTKSITSITAMMVQTTSDGDMMGLTSDIIATVDPDSRNGSTSGIGIIRSDGDPMMKTALEEAVRAIKLRYPIWEPGHIDISFGEKFVAHGGPSAGSAFGLLMLSTLEGFDLDPKCAVTGDITVDWKVRKVGGVTAKLHGATLDKCLYAAIPEDNEVAFADMALLYGTSALYDIQVFSINTLQDAEHIARTDRPAKLAEAIKLFNDLKTKLTENEKLTLHSPETISTLQHILELAPNHLSAKYLLLAAQNKAAKTLSANATLYRIDIILAPYRRVASGDAPYSRATVPLGITLNARKQIAALRPIVNKEFQPLLRDTSAFVEALEQFCGGASSYTAETLLARASAIDAAFDQLAGDKDLRAMLMREGY